MKKEIALNNEEISLLNSFKHDFLVRLGEIADHKSFNSLIYLANLMIDQEKNIFFTEKEMDKDKLAVTHAYSRGGIAKIMSFLRIIQGAKKKVMQKEGD
jgi:hypothetical protein